MKSYALVALLLVSSIAFGQGEIGLDASSSTINRFGSDAVEIRGATAGDLTFDIYLVRDANDWFVTRTDVSGHSSNDVDVQFAMASVTSDAVIVSNILVDSQSYSGLFRPDADLTASGPTTMSRDANQLPVFLLPETAPDASLDSPEPIDTIPVTAVASTEPPRTQEGSGAITAQVPVGDGESAAATEAAGAATAQPGSAELSSSESRPAGSTVGQGTSATTTIAELEARLDALEAAGRAEIERLETLGAGEIARLEALGMQMAQNLAELGSDEIERLLVLAEAEIDRIDELESAVDQGADQITMLATLLREVKAERMVEPATDPAVEPALLPDADDTILSLCRAPDDYAAASFRVRRLHRGARHLEHIEWGR